CVISPTPAPAAKNWRRISRWSKTSCRRGRGAPARRGAKCSTASARPAASPPAAPPSHRRRAAKSVAQPATPGRPLFLHPLADVAFQEIEHLVRRQARRVDGNCVLGGAQRRDFPRFVASVPFSDLLGQLIQRNVHPLFGEFPLP